MKKKFSLAGRRYPISRGAILSLLFVAVASVRGQAAELHSLHPADPSVTGVRRYIDIHVHLACQGETRFGESCLISQEMEKSFKFNVYLDALSVTRDELRQTRNEAVIDNLAEKVRASRFMEKAVVLGLDGAVDPSTGQLDLAQTQVYFPNSFILGAVRKWPNLFLYGPSINPYRRDALSRLEQAKKDGAVLIKWIPSIMNIDPADPALLPFYRKMRELKLPLLIHTGKEETFVSAKDELCDPVRLVLPLETGVTVIAAHLATTGGEADDTDLRRLRKLFEDQKYRNQLFADISATTQYNRIKRFLPLLNDPVFQGRLLNGTDWPLIEAKIFGIALTPYWMYATPFFGSILSFEKVRKLNQEANPFDRDLLLKHFLGVSQDVFVNTSRVLGLAGWESRSIPTNPF